MPLCGSVTIHGHGDPKNKSTPGEVGLGANVRNRAGGGMCAPCPRSLAVFDIMAKGKLVREGLIWLTRPHHSPPLGETEARAHEGGCGAEAVEEHCLHCLVILPP